MYVVIVDTETPFDLTTAIVDSSFLDCFVHLEVVFLLRLSYIFINTRREIKHIYIHTFGYVQ